MYVVFFKFPLGRQRQCRCVLRPSPTPLHHCSAAGHQQSKQVFHVKKNAPISRLPVFEHRDKKAGLCTLPCGAPSPHPPSIDSLCSLLTRCSSDEPALPLINVSVCDGSVPPRRGRMWEPSYFQYSTRPSPMRLASSVAGFICCGAKHL